MRDPSNSPPLRVLVVEDDLDVRSNLQDILEMDGHRVAIATSVREAAAHDDLNDYAVILLDRRLPDGNGDDLLPSIREAAPETAVILITGHANLDGAITALRHGAVDFLLKPIEPEMLRSRLSRIAEQHRMRDELAGAQLALVQSERLAAIGQTLAVLSHETRNELNGLRMGLTLLPQILDDRVTALEIIGQLAKNETRLHRLFEDVRGYAAPVQLDRTVCDVSEVWRKAWSSLEPAWKNRDVSFEEEIGDMSPVLSGDAFRLEQVFRNLFENSLAACADPVVIGISCAQAVGQSGMLSLAVRDNGPGLMEEQKEKVFDAFFTTKSSGTGLGMAIVKRIIEAHGGTVCVGDSPLRGAEFVIALPLAGGWASAQAHRPEAFHSGSLAVPSPSIKSQSLCIQH